jgi:ATP-binding cassette subfamily B (MDR/TAP) protein 1
MEKGQTKGKAPKEKKVPLTRLLKLNTPEWPYFVAGAFSSAGLGFTMPGFALALSSIISIFFVAPNSPDCEFDFGSEGYEHCIVDGGRRWALIFTGIGFGAWTLGAAQGYAFGVMGQRLARRVRVMMLKAVLRQNVGWFDAKENSSGAIIGRLSADTVAVRGAVGDQFGLLIQNLVTITAALFIAFSASWSMTLVVMATLPLLAAAAVIQNKFFAGITSDSDTLYSDANQTASEALGSIRTIAAFGMQDQICDLYARGMAGPDKMLSKQANTAGAGFGASQLIFFLVYALAVSPADPLHAAPCIVVCHHHHSCAD